MLCVSLLFCTQNMMGTLENKLLHVKTFSDISKTHYVPGAPPLGSKHLLEVFGQLHHFNLHEGFCFS